MLGRHFPYPFNCRSTDSRIHGTSNVFVIGLIVPRTEPLFTLNGTQKSVSVSPFVAGTSYMDSAFDIRKLILLQRHGFLPYEAWTMSLTRLRSFLFSLRQIPTFISLLVRSMDFLWRVRLPLFSSESIALAFRMRHLGYRWLWLALHF